MNRAIVTQLNHITFLLIYENDQLVECHPIPEQETLQIGNIYIGRVEKVVKNIQSAFIRLDSDHVGYLPLNDKPALVLNRELPKGLLSIAENDLILVQVEQEPQKLKQARVTGNICLTGDYVAMDLETNWIGISKKIRNAEVIDGLKRLVPSSLSYGLIFRTACENAPANLILQEILQLQETMDELIHRATYERKTGLVLEGAAQWMSILEEYGLTRLDEIKTDLPEVYQALQTKQGLVKCSFYEESCPYPKLLSLETELTRMLNKKVWLKSGGFLVIEPTEAMVVIDVNTGKSIGKKKKDSHIMKINEEAAIEVAHQLRLRNLSGIIVVDFINMEQDEEKKALIKILQRELRKDKNPSHFVDVTKLDLYEITRKKVRKPIHELIPRDFLTQSFKNV